MSRYACGCRSIISRRAEMTEWYPTNFHVLRVGRTLAYARVIYRGNSWLLVTNSSITGAPRSSAGDDPHRVARLRNCAGRSRRVFHLRFLDSNRNEDASIPTPEARRFSCNLTFGSRSDHRSWESYAAERVAFSDHTHVIHNHHCCMSMAQLQRGLDLVVRAIRRLTR